MAWVIGATGVGLLTCFVGIYSIGSLRDAIPHFLLVFAFAFLFYLIAVSLLVRLKSRPRWLLPAILLVGIAARLGLLPTAPTLSTDAYRYLWEGRAIVHGFNPFSHSPESDVLKFMRDDNYDDVSHKHMETIYPPVSQLVFALGAWIHPSMTMQKFLVMLFDIGVILVLIALLRARGQDPAMSIVYAWNPLVIVETASSGHLDSIGIFFLILGILLYTRGRRLAAAIVLSLSFLAKYLAGITAAFLLRRRQLAMAFIFVFIVVAGFLPFAGAGMKLLASLQTYAAEWYFNSVAFTVLLHFVKDPLITRYILGSIILAVLLWFAWREKDMARFAYCVIGGALLFIPTLYPWYVMWIVPFLCLFPNRAWILFTGLVFSSYWVWVVVNNGGDWVVPNLVYVIEFLPFCLAMLWGYFHKSTVKEKA